MTVANRATLVLDVRNRLIDLVSQSVGFEVNDSGFDFTTDEGEFVADTNTGRYEVIVRKLEES